MTGSQTERVSIQPYNQAVSILLRLATPLFNAAIHSHPSPKCDQAFEHWERLRKFASRFLQDGSTAKISESESEKLIQSLSFAHEWEHGYVLTDTLPDVETCPCGPAILIRELSIVLAEGAALDKNLALMAEVHA
jgi:hypothetical protein